MTIQFNYNKLKGRITEVCGTQSSFAESMNLSNASVSQKLNGKQYFSQEEITEACEILKIPPADIGAYFFAR